MFQRLCQTALKPRILPRWQLQFSRLNSDKPGFDAFRQKVQEREKRMKENAPPWMKRDETIKKRYGHWNPTRKLSRQQISDIRQLVEQAPQVTTKQIADHFQVNPESIRRILKSNWVPDEDEIDRIQARAQRRKERQTEQQEQKKAEVPEMIELKSFVTKRQQQQKHLIDKGRTSRHRQFRQKPTKKNEKYVPIDKLID